MTEILILGAVGKVLIYLIQKFPLFRNTKWKFLNDLVACQLCLGFWVFSFLAMALQVYLFSDLFYFPVVSGIITGAVMTFIVHLLTLGWHEKFDRIIVE